MQLITVTILLLIHGNPTVYSQESPSLVKLNYRWVKCEVTH